MQNILSRGESGSNFGSLPKMAVVITRNGSKLIGTIKSSPVVYLSAIAQEFYLDQESRDTAPCRLFRLTQILFCSFSRVSIK